MIKLISWNQKAIRFIDPPKFEWENIEKAATYEIQLVGADNQVVDSITNRPEFNFNLFWRNVPQGDVYWVITAKDQHGKPIEQSQMFKFNKVPDFDGKVESPENWEESALANTNWLLNFSTTEEELPIYMRSSAVTLFGEANSNKAGGNQHEVVYPALHHPSYIFLFLEISQRFAGTELGAKARQTAIFLGDWLLEHTLNENWKCSRFPISTWVTGSVPEELIAEQNSITLFRAARVGEAMIELFRNTGDKRYMDYAKHLAAILIQMQNEDGSWPYRVNPETGEVVEEYTSAGICIVKFLEDLMLASSDNSYQPAIQKAVHWTLEHPVKTNRWQGMYEDISEQPPYSNLENWDACETVRYLCKHADSIHSALDKAEQINRFIEDQFVIFAPHINHLACQSVYPTVMEQYVCYYPMEVHTGNWLMSLIALHQATNKDIYRLKAIRAANAITRLQFSDGRYSTWGVDWRLKTHLNPALADWYGCNAIAALSLLQCKDYFEGADCKY